MASYIRGEYLMSSKILIIGAGITGLTLAALLERQGMVAEVVEKAEDWSQLGYGITVMPAGLKIARKLQLIQKLRDFGSSANTFHFLSPSGDIIREVKLKTGGVDSITLSRNDLHSSILEKLTSTVIRMGTQVINIEETGSAVQVTFSDGTTVEYGLVIGADGLRSATRGMLFSNSEYEVTGAAIWTFFLPPGIKLPDHKSVLQVWDKNEFMGVFPCKSSAAVTFSAVLGPDEDLAHFDLKKHFANISFLGKDIVKAMQTENTYAGLVSQVSIRNWYKGRVLLAGDAAHAMVPATGMGASMGMVDAETIAELIRATPISEWSSIPKRYQKKRKFAVDTIQKEAYLVGRMMFLGSPAKEVRNELIRLVPQFVVTHQLNLK